MLKGLYKAEIHTTHGGSGRGVMVARDGRLFGGNAAFAFAGRYLESGHDIAVDITTVQRNDNLGFKPVSGADNITLRGTRRGGDRYIFEDGTALLAGGPFTADVTAISEEAAPPAGANAPDGVRNGLYSLNIRMLDGIDSGNTGLMVLHDGTIRGGDAHFDYVGAYSSAQGRWKGELINHTHTPTMGQRPLFGDREVGIGFSGTYDEDGAEGEATALAGKRSIRFKAVLRRLAD
ncbi:hypothetical protein [Bradyrhizobium sp. AUGA SZCCT0182]|uniref:hypothetical protein n=1 Tax=Bradyrhizobium sp. AUGA SZCCT0182 TaxID=2807667 RepID=UPI001BAD2352|nr:hypothetical protein [Bradyrhizobium sp. AUGA SZCCT0182]MBR1235978.1 hypothetical protein [Bradyrhizobium sp. AUGA SZCCT0182]